MLLNREISRYKSNGLLGNLVGIALCLIFLKNWFAVCKYFWPMWIELGETYNLPDFVHCVIWYEVQTVTLHWLNCAVHYFIYVGKYPFLEQYRAKATEDEQWPWESMPTPEWRKKLKRSLWINICNQILCNAFITVFMELTGLYHSHPKDLESLPSVPVFAAQVIFCCMAEDVAFYFSHRALHTPWLYKTVHKVHHENAVVYCLSAIHAHPVEYLLGNIGPMFLGPILLGKRMHVLSVAGWFFVRSTETIDTHSGYAFPWSPYRIMPFQLDQDYHFFHHESNVGNYATFFTWWDTIFGTNKAFYKAVYSDANKKKSA
jgi:sterol desaturase/sphingolipid hydroxylase (fatty acid hydroxylase superfamily)